MGISAKGKRRHRDTDGQVWGLQPPHSEKSCLRREHSGSKAIHLGAGACASGESFLNPKAGPGARSDDAEKTKTDKYKLLCQQLGIGFVPTILIASGGMGEQFQRQHSVELTLEYLGGSGGPRGMRGMSR